VSSYPVPDAAVPVSAGMMIAVPAELLASPLKSGRDLGEADRSSGTSVVLKPFATLLSHASFCPDRISKTPPLTRTRRREGTEENAENLKRPVAPMVLPALA
jgi:hypothetical protein